MNKMQAHLTLIGEDFDTNSVSGRIGMFPDKTRQKDEVLKNGRLFGHTEWGIETSVETCDDVEPLLRKLFRRIPCTPQVLYEIGKECSADWHILILLRTYGTEGPIIVFSEDLIQYLAQIHAQIGFDNYIYEEDEVPDPFS